MKPSRQAPRSVISRIAALAFAIAVGSVLVANPHRAEAVSSYLSGVDVSSYQKAPVWGDAKNAGVKFVIARATFGNVGADTQYDRNRTQLRNKRIPFTAYHRAAPDSSAGDAVAEADHFVDVARLNGKNLVPALDLESHGDLDLASLQEWVKAWSARVEERLAVKPIIYTSAAFWAESMGDTTWFADNGYRLWVNDHNSADAAVVPANNWSGQGWTVWQLSPSKFPGFKGWVDQDRFNGDSIAPLRIKNNYIS